MYSSKGVRASSREVSHCGPLRCNIYEPQRSCVKDMQSEHSPRRYSAPQSAAAYAAPKPANVPPCDAISRPAASDPHHFLVVAGPILAESSCAQHSLLPVFGGSRPVCWNAGHDLFLMTLGTSDQLAVTAPRMAPNPAPAMVALVVRDMQSCGRSSSSMLGTQARCRKHLPWQQQSVSE